ncbi:MAG: nucleotidyltransferase [Spirochaetae bacterium HGW-Spirochaetae-5]|nr:MAG: nucleotidyltransferase [Spirochaetae bacterium HGW-Spirochaetae-5]
MQEIENIKNILKEEKNNLSALGIDQIGIFGSFVRGEEKPESDIDVLVNINSESTLTLFTLVDIELRLSERLNRKVDLVIKSDLKPDIGRHILAEVEYV